MNDGMYERYAALTDPQRRSLLAAITRDPRASWKVDLSYAQRRVWFLQQLVPDSPAFNLPEAFRLTGPLNLEALDRALAAIVARHHVLCMRFPHQAGTPFQLPSARPVRLDVVPLAGATAGDVGRVVDAEADRVFDLAAEPLIRCRVFVLGPADHLLTVTMHHIVADGLSLGIFYRELAVLYEEFRGGTAALLPELTTQYADHVRGERQWQGAGPLERELGFWRDTLANAPAVFDHPTDFPRPVRQSYRSGLLERGVADETMMALRGVSSRANATMFMTLLAAYVVLLYRYSGQDDIVVGTPVAGRGRQTQEHIGLFANTVVIRIDLSGDPTFAEVLHRVRRAALDAYEHAELPHDLLVEHLKPARDPSRNPLFQVFFAYETNRGTLAGLGAATAERIEVDTRISARFDLSLAVVETDREGVQAKLGFARDLFEDSTIHTLLACFDRVLAVVAADPDVRIDAIDLLTEDDRASLVARWTSGRALDGVRWPTLHALVERQAAATPDAVAVAWRGVRLTYAELDDRANRLAHHLLGIGARAGTVVSVCLPRDPWLIAAVLAVLKTGAAYLAIDPEYPAEHVRFLLADSSTTLLVTDREQKLDGYTGTVARLSEIDLDRQPATRPPASGAADDLAYVVYTSGSTGRPKGVAVEHGNVANLVAARREAYGAETFRVGLASSSVGFDNFVAEVFVPLATGGTVVLVDSLFDLVDHPPAVPLTMIETVPSLLREFLRRAELPPTVHTMCLGGERLPADLVDAVYANGTMRRLYNGYGPAENTVSATLALIPPGGRRVPIGKPLPGVRAYVLDGRGRPVPPGMRGELHLAGASVSRGYVNRPELTRERFRPDPFVDVPGSRMYRTGDVVRESPTTGDLEWLGRADRQVKVRGQRIELGEVEHALLALPGVSGAVVTTHRDELCAYVVSDLDVDSQHMRAALRAAVPGHLIPATFVRIDQMPLRPSGKLDLAALPAPPEPDHVPSRAPQTPTEVAIFGIWCELLGRDDVGALDDFFELGGHSLLSIQVVHRIEQALGTRISMAAVFEAPTVAALAELVDTIRWMRDGGADAVEGTEVGVL